MRVLAIDPGTNMGVADGELGGTPELSVVRLRKDGDDDPEHLFGRAGRWIWERIKTGPTIDVLAIEAPIPPMVSRDYHSTRLAMGLNGLLVGVAKAALITVKSPTVGQWRKRVLGHGRMSGPDAKRAMVRYCKALNWPACSHDAAEAAGIWMWACSELDKSALLRREAV